MEQTFRCRTPLGQDRIARLTAVARLAAVALLCAVPLLLAVGGCSGAPDGGGSGDDTAGSASGSDGTDDAGGSTADGDDVPDETAPTARIVFPPGPALTDVESHLLTITGTAEDEGSGVASVSVNGEAAESEDGFATWRVVVTLADTDTTEVVVRVTDAAGNSTDAADSVPVTHLSGFGSPTDVRYDEDPELENPLDLIVDEANHRVLIVDGASSERRLLAYDLSDDVEGNDALYTVSDDSLGSGTVFTAPSAVAVTANGETIYVLTQSGSDQLIPVDAATGDRSAALFSQGYTVPDIALDEAGGRMFYLIDHFEDADDNALVALDLVEDTGSVAISSNDGTGSGTAFDRPIDLALDLENGRVFVADFGVGDWGGVFSVAVDGGQRTALSTSAAGSGDPFTLVYGVAYAANAGRLYVADNADDAAIVEVNPETGARSVVSDGTHGTGPLADYFDGIAVDSSGVILATKDTASNGAGLWAIEPTSGDRVVLFHAGFTLEIPDLPDF